MDMQSWNPGDGWLWLCLTTLGSASTVAVMSPTLTGLPVLLILRRDICKGTAVQPQASEAFRHRRQATVPRSATDTMRLQACVRPTTKPVSRGSVRNGSENGMFLP